MAFDIDYAQEAVDDIRGIRPFDQKKIIEGIETHLKHEPTKTSRSRIKQMLQPFWSQYRLRVEDYRVYYDVDSNAQKVMIVRIREKGQKETAKEAEDDAS